MSSIAETALLAYQTNTTQTEVKKPVSQAIQFAKDQTKLNRWATPEVIASVQNANGRAVDVSAINEITPEVLNYFTFDIPLNLNTTAKTTLTVHNFWTGFHFNQYQYSNNAVGAETALANSMMECDKVLNNAISSQIITELNTSRSQVLLTTGAPSGIAFDSTADALEIALANRSTRFFENLEAIMQTNDFEGGYSMLNSVGMKHVLAEHNTYGSANQKDLTQVMPSMYYDKNIGITSGSDVTSYYVQDGAFSLLESRPIEFLSGAKVGESVKWSMGGNEMPITGLRPLMFEEDYKASLTPDVSTHQMANMTVGKKIGVGFAIAFLKSYNSDLATRPNDIERVDFLNA